MPLISIQSSFGATLKKSGVVPDVLDEFKQSALILLSYGGKQVTMGNQLTVEETQKPPSVQLTFDDSTKGKSYTLVMTDPDAPTRGDQKWSEYAHWLVTGIKPDVAEGESYKLEVPKADERVKYMGPAPPPNTGLHRYVFVLIEEAKGSPNGLWTTSTDDSGEPSRANWGSNKPGFGVRDWMKEQGLAPVAVNFMECKNTEQKI